MKVKNNRIIVFGIILLLVGTFTFLISKDLIHKDKTFMNKSNIIKENKNIIAAYIKQEDGTYKEVEEIPQSGYQLNNEKSTCSNGAKPGWDVKNSRFYTDNLTKSGTSCYLYFDKVNLIQAYAIANAKDSIPDFSQVATTDEGIYATEDGMYGGTSYYWRGAATTNYVRFAGYCWRAIRINGDGTIRLIYDGSTCHQNGESTTDSIAVSNVPYNTLANQSNYAGWTYEGQLQRPTDNVAEVSSNAKIQTDNWYNTNIGSNTIYVSKIADGKYCNDREVASGYTWYATGSSFEYAAFGRLRDNKMPTLNCSNSSDIYSLKVGAITADEVAYAGGVYSIENQLFYLRNGQIYWTMTPRGLLSNGVAVFYVYSDGHLLSSSVNDSAVYDSYAVRPVINLRSDVTFSDGDGTLDNPYVVAD